MIKISYLTAFSFEMINIFIGYSIKMNIVEYKIYKEDISKNIRFQFRKSIFGGEYMDFFSVIILSMICEATWETIKMAIPFKIEKWVDRVCAMAIGIFLAIASEVDFLYMVGIQLSIPYLGMILTGLLISRGSNFMHDILSTISNVHQSTKTNNKQ
ncbi:hypothetical protein [Clostridium brassicae]|uniref:Phage holin family protein n=1 Tax=Clostridium brassicae TaxID=2999072 RepID=A0ABT4D5Z1_9CLOT|nr:hypothetical protein [Clostridium brassicae]MCY6957716.1 hypothetical protein [Clostridium brassicae]